MIRILLVIVGLIVYGSLYPWKYRPGPPGISALSFLLHSWPHPITKPLLGDIVVNIVLYMPVGIFAFFAFDRFRHRWLRIILPPLIGLALSSSIELMQVFDVTRDCSLLDVFDNTLGTAIGTAIGMIFRQSFSGSTLLVFYWLGFQVSAFFGILAGRRDAPRLLRSPIETATAAFAWFVVLYLLSTPADSGVAHPTRTGRRIGFCFLALLVLRGLVPFHFQTHATPFGWIPFLAMFGSEWIVGLPVFLEKSFYYGTAILLVHYGGTPLIRSTALVATVLAAIEVIQQYLPGRTPEITDPFMAILLGFILWLIEQDYRRVKGFDILQVQT